MESWEGGREGGREGGKEESTLTEIEKDRAKKKDISPGSVASFRNTFWAIVKVPLPIPIKTCSAASNATDYQGTAREAKALPNSTKAA